MAEKEYIDRDMYYQKINDFSKGGCGDYPLYRLAINDCVKVLDEISVADVAPVRHGEWQEINGIFRCSLCEYSFEHEGYQHFFNYCPNCGAKMDDKN